MVGYRCDHRLAKASRETSEDIYSTTRGNGEPTTAAVSSLPNQDCIAAASMASSGPSVVLIKSHARMTFVVEMSSSGPWPETEINTKSGDEAN